MGILGAVFRPHFRLLVTQQVKPRTPYSRDCKELQNQIAVIEMGIRSWIRDFHVHYRALSGRSMPLFWQLRQRRCRKRGSSERAMPFFRARRRPAERFWSEGVTSSFSPPPASGPASGSESEWGLSPQMDSFPSLSSRLLPIDKRLAGIR